MKSIFYAITISLSVWYQTHCRRAGKARQLLPIPSCNVWNWLHYIYCNLYTSKNIALPSFKFMPTTLNITYSHSVFHVSKKTTNQPNKPQKIALCLPEVLQFCWHNTVWCPRGWEVRHPYPSSATFIIYGEHVMVYDFNDGLFFIWFTYNYLHGAQTGKSINIIINITYY